MCVHHYRIETPNGPTVTGTCRHCGATRVYRAASDPGDDARWALTPGGKKSKRPLTIRRTYETLPCPECGRALKTRGGLASHLRQTHGRMAA